MPYVYHEHLSEFEVHAFLYASLVAAGYKARGCLKVSGRIPDIVVFDQHRKPLFTIEVKARNNASSRDDASHQVGRYQSIDLNVPVYAVLGMEQARRFLCERNIPYAFDPTGILGYDSEWDKPKFWCNQKSSDCY